jgi:UDP-2,4-diacetamido-2,4,6-trideoxy-beta-L-altropyranose hydrolase
MAEGDGTDENIVPESVEDANLRLRRATEQDCGLLWEWANDPTVRDCSFLSRPIPFAEHVEWFSRKLADSRCILYLAINGRSVPLGQVRYECKGEDAQVSVSVDCRFRCLGYGTKMIRLSAETVFENTDVDTIHALVKPDNEASIRVFEKAGYRRVGTQTVRNQPALHLILRRED